jgi:hypothetical protein
MTATTPRHRLTDQERADRNLTEMDFQRQLVGPNGLATMLGWLHVHFRSAKTERGWRTPGSGELLEGWPDLVLVRGRRLIFAELKRELGHLTPQQSFVVEVLQSLELHLPRFADPYPQVEVHVWRPSDLTAGRIAEVLR